MNERSGRSVEVLALVILAVLAAIGGRAVLLNLIRHKPEAIVGLVVVGAVLLVAMRRARRGPSNLVRLTITKYVLYLVSLVLVLCIVIWPVRWLFGTCISAIELALAFEIIASARPPKAVEE